MTAPLTASLDALARLDDGVLSPRDRAVIEVFDRHLQWKARLCLICDEPGGPECVRCLLDHDAKMRRAEDV